MARAFYEGTINPFRPEAVWGGSHGLVESEFPLLPAIVAVLYRLFGPDEAWGRLVVAAFAVGAVWLTYVLARDLLGRRAAGLAAATLVAFSPAAAFYGRAFMPDTLMVFFSLGAVIGFLRYSETGGRRALTGGAIALALTILVKLPGILVLAPNRVDGLVDAGQRHPARPGAARRHRGPVRRRCGLVRLCVLDLPADRTDVRHRGDDQDVPCRRRSGPVAHRLLEVELESNCSRAAGSTRRFSCVSTSSTSRRPASPWPSWACSSRAASLRAA